MRPKLNENITYTLLPDGIYLRSSKTSISLRRNNLDRFLELLPSLSGHCTLEEITQGLSTEKKVLVTKLLEALLRSGFVKDTSQDQPHTLTEAELATYSSDIAFIDSFQSSAASRFASFRNKQLLVIGSGLSFAALVQASLRCGIKQINIIRTPECDSVADSRPDLLDLFSQHGPEQRVQLIAAPQWENEGDVLNTIQAYNALLHISDRPMLARTQMLNRLCIERKKTFIQATIVDDYAWVGPLVNAETGGCWECAWRRLQANLLIGSEQDQLYTFHDQTTASISQFFTLPTASLVANRLIFELYKHFTQAGPVRSMESLIGIHLETLFCERCGFVPHPHCLACQRSIAKPSEQARWLRDVLGTVLSESSPLGDGGRDVSSSFPQSVGGSMATLFLDQIQQLQHQASYDPTTFCENMVCHVNHRLGLFTSLGTGGFVQAPLAVYKVGLSNPMRLEYPRKSLEVIGVGTDRSSAKVLACQLACEYYAASLVDQRRLLHEETIRQQGLPVIAVDQLIGAPTLQTDVEAWTWALNLYTQQVCLIPALLAFPALLHIQDMRGVGSGMSWAEAVCRALFDWCTFLAIEQVRDTQRRYAQVDLTLIPMTAEGVYLYHLLQTLGVQVTVYDVTGPLQVPTFAICVDKSVVAYSTHCDVLQALSAGLRQVMQQYQSTQARQPEYAVVPVPDLPLARRSGDRWCGPDLTIPEAWPARQEWLLQTLQAYGFHVWALPLDHDPALRQVLPYIVRVLVSVSSPNRS